jgi:mitochondrial fission protein ELM1
LPQPRIAVLLGGPNGAYTFNEAVIARFGRAMSALAAQRPEAGFMVTPSRRSPPALAAAAEQATRNFPRLIWNGEGSNPYPQFLAHADLLVVTGDSVNMTGEACATGKPVYVFHPDGGSAKFRRFHEALVDYGATRPLLEERDGAPLWRYEPLDAGQVVCAEIARRWRERVHAPAFFAT